MNKIDTNEKELSNERSNEGNQIHDLYISNSIVMICLSIVLTPHIIFQNPEHVDK